MTRSSVVVACFFGALVGACEPQPRSDNCIQYVACQEAYDEAAGLDDGDSPDVTAYDDPDGACWQSPEAAARCDDECSDAVVSLRAAAEASSLRVEECDDLDLEDDGEEAGAE